ncbi:MAG: hypothetical protein Kow0090_07040 [Myxococcota bacterium]
MTGVIIMMNNYLHDLAAALLIMGAVIMFLFTRALDADNSSQAFALFLDVYNRLVKLCVVALVFIVVGGIIRAVTFADYEWQAAIGKGLVAAIIAKHILFFALLAAGVYFWVSLRKKMIDLKNKLAKTSQERTGT